MGNYAGKIWARSRVVFHIDVGILDNDACALEMISLLFASEGRGDTYWLERYECAIHVWNVWYLDRCLTL